jgi:hypothetical protein
LCHHEAESYGDLAFPSGEDGGACSARSGGIFSRNRLRVCFGFASQPLRASP